MIREILRSYELVLQDVRRMVAGLSEEQMTALPIGDMNHPAWILGHLVFSCQMMGGEVGVAPWLPEEWPRLFATGTTPVGTANSAELIAEDAGRSLYPSKPELMAALDDGRNRLVAVLAGMTDEELNAPLPDEECRKTLPTIGVALMHILIGHTSLHAGQLSAWRRAMGLGTA